MLEKNKIKGQIEFVVIIGVALLIILAIIFLVRQSIINIEKPGITGQEEQNKLIKDSISNLIKVGTKETLLVIYNQGGYYRTDESPLTVKYKWFEMGVWSACDNITVPDVSKHISYGIADYLRNNLRTEMVFYSKNVRFYFEKIDVQTTILKDKIKVEVNLPTEVEGSQIQQPYIIEFDSKLYDVIELATEYVKNVNKSKFFETIVLASMVQSNPRSEMWVPVSGTLIKTKTLFKTREQLIPAVENIIKYSIAHIVWQREDKRLADNPFYPIDSVKGKKYDFDMMFIYPDEWKLKDYFSIDPDPVKFKKNNIPYIGPLTTYSVDYSFKFPVISTFKDNSFNQWFKLATISNIENNAAGNCSLDLSPKETNYTKYCIQQANCVINVTVKNTDDEPLKDAEVFFHLCRIGKTDENGNLLGSAPCMAGELKVYKDGYLTYANFTHSERTNVTGIRVTLLKNVNNLAIHFIGVPLNGRGAQTSEGIYTELPPYTFTGGPMPIEYFIPLQNKEIISDGVLYPNKLNLLTQEPTSMLVSDINKNNIITSTMIQEEIAPVNYSLFMYGSDNATGKALGYLNYSKKINEDDTQLCIYLPIVLNAQRSINETEIEKLMNTLLANGIEPLSTTCNYGSFNDNNWSVAYCTGANSGCSPGGTDCGADQIEATPDQSEIIYARANWRFDKIMRANESAFEFTTGIDHECERTFRLNTWIYLQSEKTIKINVTGVDNCMKLFLDGVSIPAFMCSGQNTNNWCRSNTCGNLGGGGGSYVQPQPVIGTASIGEKVSLPKGAVKFAGGSSDPKEIAMTIPAGWHRVTIYLYNVENTPGGFRFESELDHFHDLFDGMSSVGPPP